MKIAYLDPVPESAADQIIYTELCKYCASLTEVSYHTLNCGAENYEYATYEAFMLPHILTKVKRLEALEFDAVIIGCFFDPGLDAAKEMAKNIIVVGVAEASIVLARLLSKRFSLIIPRVKNYTHMLEMVTKNEAIGNLASIRTLHIRVLDLQEDASTSHVMELEIEEAIKNDNAEAVILACTMEAGKFKSLQERFGVPIIDPTVAALKMAEYLVNCKKQCGWTVSKVATYESPPENEMRSYGFS
jgi:allantoin racemase